MSERAALTKTSENKGKGSVSAKPKENTNQTMNSPVEQILNLQQTMGNQAVQRMIKSGTLLAKFKIGQPNDKYEQEADQVMRMPEPQVQRQLVAGEEDLEEDKNEPANLQPKGNTGSAHELTHVVQQCTPFRTKTMQTPLLPKIRYSAPNRVLMREQKRETQLDKEILILEIRIWLIKNLQKPASGWWKKFKEIFKLARKYNVHHDVLNICRRTLIRNLKFDLRELRKVHPDYSIV